MLQIDFTPPLGFKKYASVYTAPKDPPRRSEMTYWSRKDPVRVYSSYTDHWSKMRMKANRYCIKLAQEEKLKLTDLEKDDDPRKRKPEPDQAYLQYWLYSGRPYKAEHSFNDSISGWMDGRMPGIIAAQRPGYKLQRSWLANRFQKNALEGYKYWILDEDKKPLLVGLKGKAPNRQKKF